LRNHYAERCKPYQLPSLPSTLETLILKSANHFFTTNNQVLPHIPEDDKVKDVFIQTSKDEFVDHLIRTGNAFYSKRPHVSILILFMLLINGLLDNKAVQFSHFFLTAYMCLAVNFTKLGVNPAITFHCLTTPTIDR